MRTELVWKLEFEEKVESINIRIFAGDASQILTNNQDEPSTNEQKPMSICEIQSQ